MNPWIFLLQESLKLKFRFIRMKKNCFNIDILSVFMMKIREETCHSFKGYMTRNLQSKGYDKIKIPKKITYNNKCFPPFVLVSSAKFPPSPDQDHGLRYYSGKHGQSNHQKKYLK